MSTWYNIQLNLENENYFISLIPKSYPHEPNMFESELKDIANLKYCS